MWAPSDKEKAMMKTDSRGYLFTIDIEHPLTSSKGRVAEHRRVAWEEWGPDEQVCHWCGAVLRWKGRLLVDRLCVDHLNADKLDNAPSNLVASCQMCNAHRSKAPHRCVRRARQQLTAAVKDGDPDRIRIVRAALKRVSALERRRKALKSIAAEPIAGSAGRNTSHS
jgi:hypothetical protein